MKEKISKLALTGILGGSLVLGLNGCDPKDKAPQNGDTEPTPDSTMEQEQKYSEIHDCAGKNVCKGLGGCHVDAAKLKKLAEKAGVDMEDAGEPHECAGKNACKGLGGCHVDAAKLAKLKAALEESEEGMEEDHDHSHDHEDHDHSHDHEDEGR